MTAERKNISQPASWWRSFELQAAAENLTLSEWLGECGRANLPPGINSALTERPAANRPAKKLSENLSD